MKSVFIAAFLLLFTAISASADCTTGGWGCPAGSTCSSVIPSRCSCCFNAANTVNLTNTVSCASDCTHWSFYLGGEEFLFGSDHDVPTTDLTVTWKLSSSGTTSATCAVAKSISPAGHYPPVIYKAVCAIPSTAQSCSTLPVFVTAEMTLSNGTSSTFLADHQFTLPPSLSGLACNGVSTARSWWNITMYVILGSIVLSVLLSCCRVGAIRRARSANAAGAGGYAEYSDSDDEAAGVPTRRRQGQSFIVQATPMSEVETQCVTGTVVTRDPVNTDASEGESSNAQVLQGSLV